MANRRCSFIDPETGRHCPNFARGGAPYCAAHLGNQAAHLSQQEKLSLLEYEIKNVKTRNALGIERGKLLLALMEAHSKLLKEGSAAAPEALDWKERERRIKAEARATKHS